VVVRDEEERRYERDVWRRDDAAVVVGRGRTAGTASFV
jgi:hypothetical protein